MSILTSFIISSVYLLYLSGVSMLGCFVPDHSCIKEDIYGYIESEELSGRELALLLSKNNTLDFLYMCWQKVDTSHTEDIADCIWIY